MKHRSIGTCSWKCQISVDVAFFNSSEFYWARRCQAYNQPGGISVQTYCTPTKTRRCDGVRVSYILKETGDPSPIIKQYSALQPAWSQLKLWAQVYARLWIHHQLYSILYKPLLPPKPVSSNYRSWDNKYFNSLFLQGNFRYFYLLKKGMWNGTYST